MCGGCRKPDYSSSTVSRRLDGVLPTRPPTTCAAPPESPTLGFSHPRFEAPVTAAHTSTNRFDFALVAVLGLRISEATNANIAGSPSRLAVMFRRPVEVIAPYLVRRSGLPATSTLLPYLKPTLTTFPEVCLPEYAVGFAGPGVAVLPTTFDRPARLVLNADVTVSQFVGAISYRVVSTGILIGRCVSLLPLRRRPARATS
jgi:hypothetical protein